MVVRQSKKPVCCIVEADDLSVGLAMTELLRVEAANACGTVAKTATATAAQNGGRVGSKNRYF